MSCLSQYDEAHLIVSAIRLLTHREKTPPTIESMCEFLSISKEQGNLAVRKLQDLNIIRISQGAFKSRLFVDNHLAIEDLLDAEPAPTLEAEIRKFKDNRPDFNKKLAGFKEKQEEKRKALFADLEKKLKKEIKPDNPP